MRAQVLPPAYSVKQIGSATDIKVPALKQLVVSRLRDYEETQRYTGTASIRFGSIPSDPLGEFPVRKILSAAYVENGFALDMAEAVYEYEYEADDIVVPRGTAAKANLRS